MKRSQSLLIIAGLLIAIIVYTQWTFFMACYVSARLAVHYTLTDSDDSVYMEELEENYQLYDYEVPLITPTNPLLVKLILDFSDAFKRDCNVSLMKYVTFSRLDTGFADRVSCDWCSLCNAMLYAAKTHYTRKTFTDKQFQCLRDINEYLRETLRYRDYRLKEISRDMRPAEVFEAVDDNLTQIELVYCPFKAFEAYYRNSDPRYIPINRHTIYTAGRILSGKGLKCHECILTINNQADPCFLSDDPSPLQFLYDLLE